MLLYWCETKVVYDNMGRGRPKITWKEVLSRDVSLKAKDMVHECASSIC